MWCCRYHPDRSISKSVFVFIKCVKRDTLTRTPAGEVQYEIGFILENVFIMHFGLIIYNTYNRCYVTVIDCIYYLHYFKSLHVRVELQNRQIPCPYAYARVREGYHGTIFELKK